MTTDQQIMTNTSISEVFMSSMINTCSKNHPSYCVHVCIPMTHIYEFANLLDPPPKCQYILHVTGKINKFLSSDIHSQESASH